MSGSDNSQENFLRRWSRRKQAARAPVRETDETPRQVDAGPGSSSGAVSDGATIPVFDPAILPPVDSITAGSDVRAFLAPGVPGEISRAALRRAWVIDPAIRDFVGIAENQWDFTKPDGVPGFGALDLTPELRRMVADLFRRAPARTEPDPTEVFQAIGNPADPIPTLMPVTGDTTCEMPAGAVASSPSKTPVSAGPDPVGVVDGAAEAALQGGAEPTNGLPVSSRRSHGGAVPQ
jgi:Protein of unknown function (DUF3306)